MSQKQEGAPGVEQLRKEVAFLRNDVDHIRVCMQDMHREVGSAVLLLSRYVGLEWDTNEAVRLAEKRSATTNNAVDQLSQTVQTLEDRLASVDERSKPRNGADGGDQDYHKFGSGATDTAINSSNAVDNSGVLIIPSTAASSIANTTATKNACHEGNDRSTQDKEIPGKEGESDGVHQRHRQDSGKGPISPSPAGVDQDDQDDQDALSRPSSGGARRISEPDASSRSSLSLSTRSFERVNAGGDSDDRSDCDRKSRPISSLSMIRKPDQRVIAAAPQRVPSLGGVGFCGRSGASLRIAVSGSSRDAVGDAAEAKAAFPLTCESAEVQSGRNRGEEALLGLGEIDTARNTARDRSRVTEALSSIEKDAVDDDRRIGNIADVTHLQTARVEWEKDSIEEVEEIGGKQNQNVGGERADAAKTLESCDTTTAFEARPAAQNSMDEQGRFRVIESEVERAGGLGQDTGTRRYDEEVNLMRHTRKDLRESEKKRGRRRNASTSETEDTSCQGNDRSSGRPAINATGSDSDVLAAQTSTVGGRRIVSCEPSHTRCIEPRHEMSVMGDATHRSFAGDSPAKFGALAACSDSSRDETPRSIDGSGQGLEDAGGIGEDVNGGRSVSDDASQTSGSWTNRSTDSQAFPS